VTVLDENIIESQAQLLRSWRVPFRQIGQDIGRQGMKDDEIIPLLHSARRPTLFTRDLRFYERETPHAGYCIVALAVGQGEVASFVRRLLKHPDFNTQAKRMGTLIYASHVGVRVRRDHKTDEREVAWFRMM
jgi:hypothetical protein